MRILHCLRAPVGGLFRHVLDLASEQARGGHDVGIIADSLSQDRLTAEKFAAVEPLMRLGVERTPMNRQPGIGDYTAARTVAGYASPLRLDVLHGHGAKGGLYARLAAKRLGGRGQAVKAFYTPHGGTLNFDPKTLQGRIFFAAERNLERWTSGLIFESEHAARTYRQHVQAPRVPFRVIPNGLQAGDFEPAEPREGATDLLFVGELRELKGVGLLLDAIAQLNKQRRVTATIAGGGPDAERFKAQAETLGLSACVTFTGPLPARTAFTMGRVMVVPSLAESFPYIVLEAAAAGLPIFATNVGGIPEIVSGTDTALIEPGRSEPLAAALNSVLDAPEAARARAQRLRAKVASAYTVARMASAIEQFYLDVAR